MRRSKPQDAKVKVDAKSSELDEVYTELEAVSYTHLTLPTILLV